LALEKFTRKSTCTTGRCDEDPFRKFLAETAATIEIRDCGSPIGKQDHYASAIGGMNRLQFNSDESVDAKPFYGPEFADELESQSMLFYLNLEHEYHQDRGFVQKILKDQNEEMELKVDLHRLQRDNAIQLWEHMQYEVMERFQDHVNENWRLKRSVHPDISNGVIDSIVNKAYAAGAVAAKVCGAGGGGFIYAIVPPSMQDDVRSALAGLHELKFRFDRLGVQIIFEEDVEYAIRLR